MKLASTYTRSKSTRPTRPNSRKSSRSLVGESAMENSSSKPVAVVTGVGPGLGAALVRRFAAGYAVAMLARKADYLKSLAAELRKSGATTLDLPCDVSNHAQMTEAF